MHLYGGAAAMLDDVMRYSGKWKCIVPGLAGAPIW